MKNVFLVILVVLITVSCKNEKKDVRVLDKTKKELPTEEIKVNDYPNFTLILKAKVLLDDRFRLLYTEELGEQFSGKEIIFVDVKGSDEFQEIKFVLPKKDIYPARLRLNVGHNKEQTGIIIESIEIAHDDDKINISSSEFSKNFYPNKYIEYSNDGVVNFKEGDGKHFPFFVSRGPLHDELMSL